MPDGTLICWGTAQISRNAGQNTVTVNYPVPFISEPSVSGSYGTTHPELWFSSVVSISTTQISLYMYNSGASTSGTGTFKWMAVGRWK